jgi:hypothetical protein
MANHSEQQLWMLAPLGPGAEERARLQRGIAVALDLTL